MPYRVTICMSQSNGLGLEAVPRHPGFCGRAAVESLLAEPGWRDVLSPQAEA
jgi:hypothetical protein